MASIRYRMDRGARMSNWFRNHAEALRSLLQLSASPVAIVFHSVCPEEPDRFDGPVPQRAPDGRTGRVPAGCVFWMHGSDRRFVTVAEDHANCSVGSYTHGFVSLAEAATRGDVAAIVEARWVTEANFAAIPAVETTPGAVSYEPLADPSIATSCWCGCTRPGS